jgi:hypothetical protein
MVQGRQRAEPHQGASGGVGSWSHIRSFFQSRRGRSTPHEFSPICSSPSLTVCASARRYMRLPAVFNAAFISGNVIRTDFAFTVSSESVLLVGRTKFRAQGTIQTQELSSYALGSKFGPIQHIRRDTRASHSTSDSDSMNVGRAARSDVWPDQGVLKLVPQRSDGLTAHPGDKVDS